MACDDDEMPTLTRGSDWVWHWTTTDDASAWSGLVVELRSNGVVVASTDDDDAPAIVTDGGLEDTVPATDFAAGVLAFFVAASDTADVAANVVELGVRVLVGGPDDAIYRRSYRVVGDPAVRQGAGS